MSAKPDLWMPLFIADYMADTQHLSTEEHGAYLLLLMAAWMRGGTLPDQDAQLARIARCDKRAWARVKPAVEPFFTVTADGWVQSRLAAEYAHAVKVNDAQRENGRKGGRPKKAKPDPDSPDVESQTKPTGSDRDNPTHIPLETPPPPPRTLSPDTPPERTRHARPPASFEPVPAPVTSLTTANPAVPLAVAMNAAGFRCTALNPDLVAYAQAGGSVVHLLDVARHPDCHGKPVTYVARFALRELTAIANPITGDSHARPKESLAQRVTRKAIAEELADRSATRDDDARSLGADDGDVRPPLVQHVR